MTPEAVSDLGVSPAGRPSVVAVTGAGGFVGRFVCRELEARGFTIRTMGRSTPGSVGIRPDDIHFDLLEPTALSAESLRGVDAVVHLAARVHVMKADARDDALFMTCNAVATERLARAAATAGVRRLVFLSSIKVNGEYTPVAPFRPDDTPAPVGAYALSKYAAERALHQISAETGLQVCIIRPPMVYGPGVAGNFLRMLRWVERGLPLPFRHVHNRRSNVSVWNLADLVARALVHPAATRSAWLCSDGEAMSTDELLLRIGELLGKSPRLLPIPRELARLVLRLTSRSEDYDRLYGSLEVDDSATRLALGWEPPVSLEIGLARTAAWYLKEGTRHRG